MVDDNLGKPLERRLADASPVNNTQEPKRPVIPVSYIDAVIYQSPPIAQEGKSKTYV